MKDQQWQKEKEQKRKRKKKEEGERKINGKRQKEEKCVTLYARQAFSWKRVKAIALTLKNRRRTRDPWLGEARGHCYPELSVLQELLLPLCPLSR